MEVRMILSKEAAEYVSKVAYQRRTTNGAAIDRIICEVIKMGGIAITDHIKPDETDENDQAPM